MEQLELIELKKSITYNPLTGEFIRKTGKQISIKPDKTTGYLRIMVNRKHYLAHRLAWLYVYGYMPTIIDHIDGNKTNNKLSNLREVSSLENQRNLTLAKNNTSGVTGVSFSKSRNKWEAKIQVNGKTIHLGRFIELEDAIIARKQGELKYGFHKNHGKQCRYENWHKL